MHTFLIDESTSRDKLRSICKLLANGNSVKLLSPHADLMVCPESYPYAPPYFMSLRTANEKLGDGFWGWWPCVEFQLRQFLWMETSIPMEMPKIPDTWELSDEVRNLILVSLEEARKE